MDIIKSTHDVQNAKNILIADYHKGRRDQLRDLIQNSFKDKGYAVYELKTENPLPERNTNNHILGEITERKYDLMIGHTGGNPSGAECLKVFKGHNPDGRVILYTKRDAIPINEIKKIGQADKIIKRSDNDDILFDDQTQMLSDIEEVLNEPGISYVKKEDLRPGDDTSGRTQTKSWWNTLPGVLTAAASVISAIALAYPAVVGRPIWDIILPPLSSSSVSKWNELEITRVEFQNAKPEAYRIFANINNSWYSLPRERLALSKSESWYAQQITIPPGSSNFLVSFIIVYMNIGKGPSTFSDTYPEDVMKVNIGEDQRFFIYSKTDPVGGSGLGKGPQLATIYFNIKKS